MKKIHLSFIVPLLFIFGALFPNQANAQSCATIPNSGNSKMADYVHVNTFPHVNNNSYCLKVYVHNVMRSDLTGGVSESVLSNQINILNNQFSGTGISFVWDGNILELSNDTVYNSDIIEAGTCPTINFSALTPYAHADGIDLFFYGRSIGGSAANGIAGKSQVAITPGHLGTAALAHELGHALGLFHPFHGTIGYGPFGANENNCENNDGFSGHVAECPSGNNAYTAGDYVGDTDATTTDFQCNLNNCTATAVNDNTTIPLNCNGYMFPDPDITNYMLPGIANCNPLACGDGFTPLQIRRMKYFISRPAASSLPHIELHDAVLTSCSPPSCGASACNMDAFFTKDINQCDVVFNGENLGQYCPNYEFRWKVDGTLVGTTENLNYTFPSSGTYDVCFTIINTTSNQKVCLDEYCETVTVSCLTTGGGDPTCPPINTQMFINEVENCIDYQANVQVTSDVDHIDWFYRLCGVNGGNEVPIGTTSGNSSNQHTVPIYLPTGNYDNCILIVNAYPVLSDQTVCTKITGTRLLNCNGNGGGQKVALFPNPTQSTFTVQTNGDSEIATISVRDVYGIQVESRKSNAGQTIDLSGKRLGVYFVEVKFVDGTSEIKKLILEQ